MNYFLLKSSFEFVINVIVNLKCHAKFHTVINNVSSWNRFIMINGRLAIVDHQQSIEARSCPWSVWNDTFQRIF